MQGLAENDVFDVEPAVWTNVDAAPGSVVKLDYCLCGRSYGSVGMQKTKDWTIFSAYVGGSYGSVGMQKTKH